MKTSKLGIIGIGNVGEHVLAYAMQTELFAEICLIDTRTEVAFGQALDQAHATGLSSRHRVRVKHGEYQDLADADIIIIAATHRYEGEVPGDRQLLMADNAVIIRSIMQQISQVTKEAILIMITNPADTVVYLAASEYDYPKEKIIGTGTLLDTARLKYTLAEYYQVDPKSIDGYMIGEHGYTALPVLSRLSIGGMGYDELSQYFPDRKLLSAEVIKDKVVQAAYEVFHARSGVTNAGVAQASIELARAVLLNTDSIYPVSTYCRRGIYDFVTQDTAFSLPCLINRTGLVRQFPIQLNAWEVDRLKESIASIDQSIASL